MSDRHGTAALASRPNSGSSIDQLVSQNRRRARCSRDLLETLHFEFDEEVRVVGSRQSLPVRMVRSCATARSRTIWYKAVPKWYRCHIPRLPDSVLRPMTNLVRCQDHLHPSRVTSREAAPLSPAWTTEAVSATRRVAIVPQATGEYPPGLRTHGNERMLEQYH